LFNKYTVCIRIEQHTEKWHISEQTANNPEVLGKKETTRRRKSVEERCPLGCAAV
jgi:hypothetical protein